MDEVLQLPALKPRPPKREKVFLDGRECPNGLLPEGGPYFIVWGPGGCTPVRYVFTRRDWAENAASQMAKRFANQSHVFYVATLLTWHQHQVGPAVGDVLTSGSDVVSRMRPDPRRNR